MTQPVPPANAPRPPQRVCPHCATVAATTAPECPHCGRSYRRQVLPGVALLLVLFAGLILGGVAAMLTSFGGTLEDELDTRVQSVERDFDRDVRGIQEGIRRELDRRLPATAGGGATP